MKDIGWVAAMGRPGGGRNDVDPRFISLFSVFNMTFPSEESLFHIYNSILSGHTKNFNSDIQGIVQIITKMTMELYRLVEIYLSYDQSVKRKVIFGIPASNIQSFITKYQNFWLTFDC